MSVLVHFDRGAFHLKCPFHANDVVRSLPSVRFSKSKGIWIAPLMRRNVEALINIAQASKFTQEAQDAIHKYQRETENRGKKTGEFPHWYRYKTKPLDHQRVGLDRHYPQTEFAMFMDMGTGKSKLAIDFNTALRMEGKIDAWLIVCKLSLRQNWVEQLELHCPIPYSAHLPYTDKQKDYDQWISNGHDFKVLIVGIESLSAGRMIEMASAFTSAHIRPAMTLDESSLISSHNATRSERVVSLGRTCAYRQALTGTPIADSPMNLFMQYQYLDPDIIGIGDFFAFRNRYAVMGGYRDPRSGKPMQIVGYQNLDELVETVAPWTYQVKKSDVLDLPPKVYQTRTVSLTKEQSDLIKLIKKDAAYQVDGRDVSLANVLEKVLRLHQISGSWMGETYMTEEDRPKKATRLHKVGERNPKLEELKAIVEETNGQQGIVWCAYRHEIEDCKAAIKELGYTDDQIGLLHGGVSEEDRKRLVPDFQSGRVRWIVGNAATGGMGFTLTAATVVIYYSNTQKLIDRLQSEDRAHRHGQTKSVLYIDIVAEKSVDGIFINAIQEKKDVADYVRDKLDQVLRDLG